MGRLNGKTVLITGGTSGIGLASVHRFKAEGANVAVTGRNQEALDNIAAESNGTVLTIRADAANLDETQAALNTTVATFGKIDILFLNAGIALFAPVEQTPLEMFDNTMNINFRGPFYTVQAALPHLNDGASILFTTSVVNEMGMPNGGVYSASKAALRSLVRTLSVELAPRRIRVNAVSPGPINTPIFGKTGLSEQQLDDFGKQILSNVPLGRMGESDEIANVALFLASDEASFVTGAEYTADGGMLQ